MTEEAINEEINKEVSTTDPSKGIAALKQVLMDEKIRHADTELQLALTRIELKDALEELSHFRAEALDDTKLKAVDELAIEDALDPRAD